MTTTPPDEQHAATREAFPRGLFQPERRFRFSIDALLLGSFAAGRAAGNMVDLGAGCGVAGLAVLLARPGAPDMLPRAVAVDVDPAMADAAQQNACRLGFADRILSLVADVRAVRSEPQLPAGEFDLAICNPPYRRLGQGRLSPSAERCTALFETNGELADFFQAAAYLLKNRGRFCLVIAAARLAEALKRLSDCNLEPKRLVPVYSRRDAPAPLALIEARRNGKPGLSCEAPLVLYEGRGPATRLTEQALAFCPFLACNAGASGCHATDA